MNECFSIDCMCEGCFALLRQRAEKRAMFNPQLLEILRSPTPLLRDLAEAIAH